MHDIQEMVGHAGAEQVYGTPISNDGLTVLPVAKVNAGGGGGEGARQTDHGEGGGLGLSAKPLGVFVLRNGKVAWRPAVDVNKVILGAQVVAIVALIVLRSVVKARRKA
jgi:uncharacterized spore protein YtfJ